VASGNAPEQVFYDAELRDVKLRVVEAPAFAADTCIADTHAHLDMLHYPELVLARAAARKVLYIVSVIDPTEDPPYTLDNLDAWLQQANELLEEWTQDEDDVGQGGRGLVYQCRDDRLGRPFTSAAQPNERPGVVVPTKEPSALPDVSIIMGCHPHNAASYNQAVEEQMIQALTTDARVVGIGEVGLDYHYDHSPRDVQQQVYRRQIQLAHEYEASITLHMREAHADGLRILTEEGVPKAGLLLHCFNLDYATLEPFLELGAMVAFGGPLTFKKADEVRDAAARCPLDRIMTETDCPFMAPTPIRGSICEPASVVFVADMLKSLREEPDALEKVYANARRFFYNSP